MRAADPAVPLSDAELDALFVSFADARRIALAVSGGADSLALMLTAQRWRERRASGPELIVLTVDHRLRPDSRREAAEVVTAAQTRGLTAHVLVRAGPSPAANIEAEARRARYRLLLDAARRLGASHLLTAHHRDDVAETLVLRLQRGSGVFGLAATRPAIDLGGLILARPLIDVPRVRLAATTAAAGLTPAADAMNSDPRFARSRVRILMPLLAKEGLDAAHLAAAARRLADAADAIDDAATSLIEGGVTVDDFAVVHLDPDRFARAPEALRSRVAVRLLMAIGGGDYPPRFERLAALTGAMAGGGATRFKRTLAGCVVESAAGGKLVLYREFGREAPPMVGLSPGATVVWDHRFAITAGHSAPTGLSISALGEGGRLAIGAGRGLAPRGAVVALPALRRRGRIIAVPPFGYFASSAKGLDVTIHTILGQRLVDPPLFPDLSA